MTPTGSAIVLSEDSAVGTPDGRHATNEHPALRLSLSQDGRPLSPFSLATGRYVVGSDAACDLVVEAPDIHPRHCLIIVGRSRAVIRTYAESLLLNGEPIDESPLAAGDRVSIGSVEFEVTSTRWKDRAASSESGSGNGPTSSAFISSPVPISPADESLLIAVEAERLREQSISAGDSSCDAQRAADLVRRERLLREFAALVLESQADSSARERSLRNRATALEAHLKAVALVEEKQATESRLLSDERTLLAAERSQIAEKRSDVERLTTEAACRLTEVGQREAELEQRSRSLDSREEQLRHQEFEAEKRIQAAQSARRRLLNEQEELAIIRVTAASERASLEGARAELELRCRASDASQDAIEAQRQAFQQAFTQDYVAIEEIRASLNEREAMLKTAEVEVAWRAQDLDDREQQLERLAVELEAQRRDQASHSSQNGGEESSSQTPGGDASMPYENEESHLPDLNELVVADNAAAHSAEDQPSLSSLLGVQRIDAGTNVMERLTKVEHLLETLLQRLPSETAAIGSETPASDGYARFNRSAVEEPRPVVIELDDAQNSGSVSRYMEQLLVRMRVDNPLVPAPATARNDVDMTVIEPEWTGPSERVREIVEDERVKDDLESAVTILPLPVDAAKRPEPRTKLTKDEMRAQTSSLREVANLSARHAISRHSMRRYKAELTVKAVLSIVAFALAVSAFTANITSDGGYLWQTVSAFIAVGVIVFDFLLTVRRFPDSTPSSETSNSRQQSESGASTAMEAEGEITVQAEESDEDAAPRAGSSHVETAASV